MLTDRGLDTFTVESVLPNEALAPTLAAGSIVLDIFAAQAHFGSPELVDMIALSSEPNADDGGVLESVRHAIAGKAEVLPYAREVSTHQRNALHE